MPCLVSNLHGAASVNRVHVHAESLNPSSTSLKIRSLSPFGYVFIICFFPTFQEIVQLKLQMTVPENNCLHSCIGTGNHMFHETEEPCSSETDTDSLSPKSFLLLIHFCQRLEELMRFLPTTYLRRHCPKHRPASIREGIFRKGQRLPRDNYWLSTAKGH